VQARRFRQVLYPRLAVVTLRVLLLRERGADILSLAEHFLRRACEEYGLPPKTLTGEARTALLAHPWPGHVRELANVMERVALLSEGTAVTPAVLGLRPSGSFGGGPPPAPGERRPARAPAPRPRPAP